MEDIMAFKARLDKKPKDLEALISLANANMMISRFDAAQDLYTRALSINPKDLDVRTNLAIAYHNTIRIRIVLVNQRLDIHHDDEDCLPDLAKLRVRHWC